MKVGSNKAIRYEMIGFAVCFALTCVFIILYSPAVLLYVGHDVSPVLDGAWRIENHQVPHKDFSSILGHGYLLQQDLFLKIFHYDFIAFAVSSIATTTVAFAIFLSVYSSDKFLANTGFPLRVYLFLLLLSLGLGQYHFGEKHTLLTYANLYNRYCFLCLFVLLLQVFLCKDERTIDKKMMTRLVVMALLLNYLLFVKLTYFLVAVGLLTLCFFLSLLAFKLYWRLLLLSGAICIVLALITKADLPAMLHDYKTISAARGAVFTQLSFVRYKLFQYYNLLFLGSLVVLMAELFFRKVSFKYLLLIGCIGLCAVLLQFTNWGSTDMVMLTFVPVVVVLLPHCKRLISFKLFLAACCFFIFKNGRSIYYLTKAKDVPYTEVKSPYLSRFYTDFKEVACNEDYATKVMSGVDLINKNKKTGDRVFSFSFDNPFPFLTHTVPPKHLPTVWQYATTYTYTVHEEANELFSEVDLLLVPQCLRAESATEMMAIYGRTVTEQYSVIDSNNYWVLYRKTAGPANREIHSGGVRQ